MKFSLEQLYQFAFSPGTYESRRLYIPGDYSVIIEISDSSFFLSYLSLSGHLQIHRSQFSAEIQALGGHCQGCKASSSTSEIHNLSCQATSIKRPVYTSALSPYAPLPLLY